MALFLPPLGDKDPLSLSGRLFLSSIIKMEPAQPRWDSTQSQRVGEFSFTGVALHRKLTPSFLGGGVRSTFLRTNVLFKGAKVWPGGESRSQGQVILKTMCFSCAVNHSALRFLTHWINGINCVRGWQMPLGQRSHCSA